MQATDSFDLAVQDNVDKYKVLPVLQQVMEPEEKRTAVGIVNRHNCTWSVDCMKELVNKLTVTLHIRFALHPSGDLAFN